MGINEQIAKICGWVSFPDPNVPYKGGLTLPYQWINKNTSKTLMELPAYDSDLNAIHEAELQFFDLLVEHKHWNQLCEAMGYSKGISNGHWHATAKQRAEAFLKTLERAEKANENS